MNQNNVAFRIIGHLRLDEVKISARVRVIGLLGSATVLGLVFVFNNILQIDLRVYRLGASAWLTGHDLYGPLPTVAGLHLPFTYPPFAAIVLSPFALLPLTVAAVLMAALTTCGLIIVVVTTCQASRLPGWVPWLILPLALLIRPVRDTLGFGQVNVILMALVTWDCLRRKSATTGIAVGIAAAVKLTPAFMILFFILSRDFRSAARTAATFLTASLLGFVLAPRASSEYWLGGLFHLAQSNTSASYWRNQSWYGALLRLHVPISVWFFMLALTLAAALPLARWFIKNGEKALALSALAIAQLLFSPISWDHHWVWFVPILLAMSAKKSWCYRSLVIPVLVIVIVEPFLSESIYVILGVALLLSWCLAEGKRAAAKRGAAVHVVASS